jgi:hypothetical protein
MRPLLGGAKFGGAPRSLGPIDSCECSTLFAAKPEVDDSFGISRASAAWAEHRWLSAKRKGEVGGYALCSVASSLRSALRKRLVKIPSSKKCVALPSPEPGRLVSSTNAQLGKAGPFTKKGERGAHITGVRRASMRQRLAAAGHVIGKIGREPAGGGARTWRHGSHARARWLAHRSRARALGAGVFSTLRTA